MPKDTFLNLPEEKCRLIEGAAIDEFAVHGFDNASINRIVVAASIAKGSFYQYFEDKIDLFKHLIARIAEEKLKYISPVLQNPEEHDFFILMQELYRSGLAFAKQNPKLALIGNQIAMNMNHPVHAEILGDAKATARDFYAQLIALAIARGEVRADINQDFIAHLLISLNFSLFEYYFEVIKGREFDMRELDDEVMDTVNLTLDFIKNGIKL